MFVMFTLTQQVESKYILVKHMNLRDFYHHHTVKKKPREVFLYMKRMFLALSSNSSVLTFS